MEFSGLRKKDKRSKKLVNQEVSETWQGKGKFDLSTQKRKCFESAKNIIKSKNKSIRDYVIQSIL